MESYTIETHYTNRTEYYPTHSLWAANLIAAKFAKNNGVRNVIIIDNITKELKKIIVC